MPRTEGRRGWRGGEGGEAEGTSLWFVLLGGGSRRDEAGGRGGGEGRRRLCKHESYLRGTSGRVIYASRRGSGPVRANLC